MTELRFDIRAMWAHGEGQIETGGQSITYSGPASMGGKGKGTSPEELLVSAVTACYSGTLVGVLRQADLPVSGVQIEATGYVADYPEHADFNRLVVSPLVLGGDPSRIEEYRAASLKARDRCFIGRVVRDHLRYEVGEVQVDSAGVRAA